MAIATPEVYAQMLDKAKAGAFAYPAINVSSSQTLTLLYFSNNCCFLCLTNVYMSSATVNISKHSLHKRKRLTNLDDGRGDDVNLDVSSFSSFDILESNINVDKLSILLHLPQYFLLHALQ